MAVTASTPSDAESAFETASVDLYEVHYSETREIEGVTCHEVRFGGFETLVVEEIAYKALIRQSRARLNAIEEIRDAKQLSLVGKSQREIAEVLNTTQSRVHRILRGAKALGNSATPEEVILRAALGVTARERLVKDLSTMHYTFTTYAPSPHEGSIPGTWNQVGAAHVLGLLSDEEYEAICVAVRPPVP